MVTFQRSFQQANVNAPSAGAGGSTLGPCSQGVLKTWIPILTYKVDQWELARCFYAEMGTPSHPGNMVLSQFKWVTVEKPM